ncbi:DUF1992 domain-containing protein [Rhodococcus sp. BP-349]|uniref:DnaJ family domain-containing protein n=1 Tax=unclassified Rhodococcus (in: high G+C Gram-positive bacteria) TaxID=192944 RepID=UPI001C9A9FFD|nr:MULTISPECIES: DUF1992 domain-containing protein [unclassified Rhodococcus (in: high G+C Gram-positive bacteria)]MBY6538320.1 DUF1992 domain-containing protein [Rhodococcus sp. BP-363]MBY6542657.1 DUF1992 domain-containing protein [Rhodococcus sp. BP-369]MBY6561887.1 DUF1992 domain-containing protein [Rhodococcus sp. BP-370]MBY6576179.1 DUF1992 domain-containing protein [Rhodococcus sp. BP-364]MBY6585480.1 DUF1992 domain-containing protein [Rhodococcus sp. BP-358]
MTERKPSDISVQTWVDRQIASAQESGAFENLPGLGKPIPPSSTDELSWVRGYLKRENLSGDALLPTPLRLRKEVERLPEALRDVRSEDAVRAIVSDLNARIMDWLRAPVGPQVPIGRVDADEVVAQWTQDRAAARAALAAKKAVLQQAGLMKPDPGQPEHAASRARRPWLRWVRRRP